MRVGIYRRVRRRRAGRRRRRRGPDLLREAGRRAADLFFLRHAGRANTIRGLTIIDRIVRPGAVFRRINTKRMLFRFYKYNYYFYCISERGKTRFNSLL